MRSLAALSLLFNALVWGLSWWPLRHLQQHGLHPLWATMLFFMLGAAVIAMWQPSAWRIVVRQQGLLALAAVAGLTNALFNWGVAVGDVVRVVLLFYLMPLWAALLARWLLNEPITRQSALRMALALIGAALVLKPEGDGWPRLTELADWLGLLGGMGFALTNVLLRQQAEQPAAARALAMFAGGVVVPGLLGWALWQASLIPPWPVLAAQWAWPALAMGGLFILSNLALQYGAARLPVQLTSVLMLTEVLFAALSSAWLAQSALAPHVLMGGGLILGASLLAAWGER